MRVPGVRAAALLAVACAQDVQVGISYDPLTAFPKQASYAWDERENRLPNDERVQSIDLDPLIKRVVVGELAARGWNETAGDPDYLISYHLSVATWHGAEGSLSLGSWSLQINEAEDGQRVWVGFARAEVQMGLSEAEREQRFRKATRQLLEHFPPAGR
jgi:hypothetical protein